MVELEDNIFYLILELIRLRSFSFDIDPLLDLQAWQKIVLYELFKKNCMRPSLPILPHVMVNYSDVLYAFWYMSLFLK